MVRLAIAVESTASSGTMRPPPALLAMMFGDSRSVSLTPSSASDSRDNPRFSARSPLAWWAALYGRRALIGAAGQGGQPSSIYQAHWPVVRAQRPMTVLFHGVVNDLNADIATGALTSLADGHFAQSYFNRLSPFASEVLDWGGTAIFCTEPLGAGANQAARIIEAARYDALIVAWADAHGQPVIDMKAMMRDPSSTSSTIILKGGYCYDTLHPGDYGARRIAEDGFAPVLNAIFPDAETRADAIDGITPVQLLTNPWFAVPTGGSSNAGVTGSTPLGWTTEMSGAAGAKTATIATTVRTDGRGKDAVLTLTSDTAGQIVRMRSDFTAAAQAALATFNTDMKIRLIVELEVIDGDPLASAYGIIQANVNGVLVPVATSDLEIFSTAVSQQGAYSMRIKTPWYVIPSGTALSAMQARLFLVSAGPGSVSARLGVAQVEARAT